MWVLVDKKDIQSIRIQTGPPIKLVKHAEAFKKKHTDTFIKNARLFARVKRKHTNAHEFIKELIKESYVKEKVKEIDLKK